jgi:HD-GYP domain-containing protein (c-di-GMP phosphodiesterase class II)
MRKSAIRPGAPTRPHITIRMTVIAAIVLATALTALVAITLQYYFGNRLVADATQKIYVTTVNSIAAEIERTGRSNGDLLRILAENTAVRERAGTSMQIDTLTHLMQGNPLFYSIYVGHPNGSFSQIINLEANPSTKASLQAAKAARWAFIHIPRLTEHPRQRHYTYYDSALNTIGQRTEPTDFDPTLRDWFTSASADNNIQRSQPYRFAQLGIPGRTLSMRIPGSSSVVAIDLTLESVSSFLQDLAVAPTSEIFVYDRHGEVFASSAGESAQRRVSAEQLLEIANDPNQREQLVEVTHAGEPHIAFGSPLQFEGDARFFVGIISPKSTVTGPMLSELKLSIAVASAILLLVLPLSWFFAGPIVKPVRLLALETEKVRRREFDRVRRIPSHITELDELSDSMVSMVSSIQQYEQAQEDLIDSMIKLIAQAIDEKSPYTGRHCERVPELALMLAAKASASTLPAFQAFKLTTDDQWREFRTAAWLHDCGKITTPEHIVDKGSKLEIIYNRIHEVRMRFEVLWRDAEIDYLNSMLNTPSQKPELTEQLQARQRQLQADFEFIATCNVGDQFLNNEQQEKLKELAAVTWTRYFDDRLGLSPEEELAQSKPPIPTPAEEQLLADKAHHIEKRESGTELPGEYGIKMDIPENVQNRGELYNLLVPTGTLTPEDRFRINEHMISTIKMLEGLPFPKELKQVPRYASTHHETLDGTGYPRKLSSEHLGIPDRILAIADIFEALTASDRPYKHAKSVTEAVKILHKKVENGHLDRDCFELFLREGVHEMYATRFLASDQQDLKDIGQFLATAKSGE